MGVERTHQEILSNLDVLSEAQEGYKLCKSSRKWYSGSGIFNALYRTVSGESRQDIIDIMDEVVDYLTDPNIKCDVLERNALMFAIPKAIVGCEKIIQTYKDDENYISMINERVQKINQFKEQRPKDRLPSNHMINRIHGDTAIAHTIGMVMKNNKAGTQLMDSLTLKK